MATIKCNYCGGENEIDANREEATAVCEFCGSMMTIPRKLVRKGNLYNRAVFLRQNNEFDQAEAIYEDILREDNTDAEAHWGLALSKYGIEYVEDPTTKERIPTCHRMLLQTILADHDYQAAIKAADAESRQVWEREGKRINQIQQRILEISRQEKPYDIFISYKDTDEVGNRTEDSVLAQEIYEELVKKNYRVFFSRKTLESKLGTEFEPIIYAALSSASVMLVVGTRTEYFQAVWVRNEWSRFLKMSKEKAKTIIPVYRGMSPYELPAELVPLQGQNMGKIGAMQDLLDGVERCMRYQKGGGERSTASAATGVERLLEKGDMYLRLKAYDKAFEAYTRVIEAYPDDYRGWRGMILAETKEFTDIRQGHGGVIGLFRRVTGMIKDQSILQELQEKYVGYMKQVALLDAENEMKSVKTTLEDIENEKIASLQNQIVEVKGKIQEKGKYVETGFDDQQEELKKRTKEHEMWMSEKAKKITCCVLGCVLLIIGPSWLMWFLEVGQYKLLKGTAFEWGGTLWFNLLSPLAVLGIGIFLLERCTKYPKLKEINEQIAGWETLVYNTKEKIEETKENLRKEIADLKAQIAKLEEQIAAHRQCIGSGQRYIALGAEKISGYWFAQICAESRIKEECNEQVIEYRNAYYQQGSKEA